MNKTEHILQTFMRDHNDLYTAMENCDHHYDADNLSPYHLEGKCSTHTMMVLKNAKDLGTSSVLLISALLHDIGKPMTRSEIYKKLIDKTYVAFYGHSGMSNYLSVNVLNNPEFDLNYDQKVRITEVINLHIDFFQTNLTTKEDGIIRLTKNGQQLFKSDTDTFECLMELAYCDDNGRISGTGEIPTILDKQVIREEVAKMNLMDIRPIPRKEDSPIMTMLIGVPNSGKSTYLTKHHSNDSLVSRDQTLMDLHPDMSYNDAFANQDSKLVDRLVREKYTSYIRSNDDIVHDMTNMTRKSRRKFLTQLPPTYYKRGIVFMTDFNEILERNENRSKSEGKHIPEHVIINMCKSFQVPLRSEFDEIHYIF